MDPTRFPRRSILTLGLLLPCLVNLLPASVPDDLPVLVRPEAGQLDEAALQRAMGAAVHAGVLFLLEEIHDPGNPTALVYPPHSAPKKVGEKVVERRYRLEKQPIYEEKEVERLVPVRDEYGAVTGYEKRRVKVRASDRVVGWREVQISDPEGPIVRQVTIAIVDRSNRLLPRGWWGLNAQGLLLLCRAGLGRKDVARRLANELEALMAEHGQPDTTWDLAWLTLAFIELAEVDEQRADRRDRLIHRLADGTTVAGDKRHPALGLWGPVSINHPAQARFFTIELELQQLYQELEAKIAAATSERQRAALRGRFGEVAEALREIQQANRGISQQGRRLSEVELVWAMEEDLKTAGLSHYLYNRDIADLDSTAVALLALAEAHRRELLPEVTELPRIKGRTLMSGVETGAAFAAAYRSVLGLAGPEGSFDSGASLFPLAAYDDVPHLAGVPLKARLPELLRPETWRSNISAAAAIALLEPLVDERDKRRIREREAVIAANRQRVLAIVEAWLGHEPDHTDWSDPHAGQRDSLEALAANGGWPRPPARDEQRPATPVDELAVGHLRTPRELLEGLLVLHRAQDEAQRGAARRLAYRLLIEQQDEGCWRPASPPQNGAPGVSAGERAYLLGKLAQRHWWQAERDAELKPEDPITTAFERTGPYLVRQGRERIRRHPHISSPVFKGEGNEPHGANYPGSAFYIVDMRLAETLAALVFLEAGLSQAVAVTDAELAAILERSQLAAAAHEQALLELEDDDGDLARQGPSMARSPKDRGEALRALWNAILAAAGSDQRVPEPRDEAPAAPAGDDPAPGPVDRPDAGDAEDAGGGKTLDDILGG